MTLLLCIPFVVALCLSAPNAGQQQEAPAVAQQAPTPWIARVQTASGAWQADEYVGQIGVTSLVLLAFFGDGGARKAGPYQASIERGSDWLLKQQDAASGCFGATDRVALRDEAVLLDHAWATLAVSELLYVDGEWQRGLAARAKAVEALLAAQREDGSFGTARATGWSTYALVSARESGEAVPPEALQSARTALMRQVDIAGDPAHLDAGKVALRCLIGFMVQLADGAEQLDADAMAAIDRIIRVPDLWSTLDPESFMLVTVAAYQSGGETWRHANVELKRTLLPKQVVGAKSANHGAFPAFRGHGAERATAFGVLALETYFRYGRILSTR